MRQLCCHPQLSKVDRSVLGDSPQTLEQIRDKMMKHMQDERRKLQRALEKAERELAEYKDRIAASKLQRLADQREDEESNLSAATLKKRNDLRKQQATSETTRLQALENLVAESKANKAQHEITSKYFESLTPRATEALAEPCLICFDDIEDASITKCGHIFCTNWYVQTPSHTTPRPL